MKKCYEYNLTFYIILLLNLYFIAMLPVAISVSVINMMLIGGIAAHMIMLGLFHVAVLIIIRAIMIAPKKISIDGNTLILEDWFGKSHYVHIKAIKKIEFGWGMTLSSFIHLVTHAKVFLDGQRYHLHNYFIVYKLLKEKGFEDLINTINNLLKLCNKS